MRLKVISITSVLWLLFSVIGFSQIDTTWIKTYGGNRDDKAYDIIHTQDSGFLIIGSTSSFGFDNAQMYFLKLDSTGAITWSKSHGGSNQEAGHSVIQTSDGGYLGVGYTNSWGSGGFDLLMVKLDASGNTIFEKYFGGTDWDFAWDVLETQPNVFVMAGETQSFGSGGKDAWIVRYDANNDLFDWNHTFGDVGTDDYKSITKAPTGGFYAAGRGVQPNHTDEDVMVTRFDANGDTIWNRYYGDTLQDYANDILWFSDSSFVFTGCSFIQDTGVAYTVKVSKYDTVTWMEKWNKGSFTEALSILERPDGNPGVFGNQTNSILNSEFWYIFMGFNGSGNMGSLENDFGAKMIQNQNGKYIMAGSTLGFNSNFSNILIYLTVDGQYDKNNTYWLEDTSNVVSTNSIKKVINLQISYIGSEIILNFDNEKEKSLLLFDQLGRNVNTYKTSNSVFRINAGDYSKGIYFLKISEGTNIFTSPIYLQGL